jgi:signal peptidase II
MSFLTRNRVIGLVIAALVFLLDQGVKKYVVEGLHLRAVGKIDLLPFFDLTWVENRGVSLGILTATSPEMRYLLIALTGAIAIFVLAWMMREKVMSDILGLALVLGGAVGNIRDRATMGYVIDYADLHFGDFRPFLVFNIADAAITIGVLIILARSLLSRDKPETEEAPGETATES